MKEQVTIFKNPSFGKIRIVGTQDKPLFCLSDVCESLGLIKSKVVQRLERGVLSRYPLHTNGGTQQFTFVNEDGLYDVILDSRKPEAKVFRKWITSDVLPSIRKTGGYISTSADMTDEEIMARALNIANDTIRRRDERIRLLEQQNALMLPKARVYEQVINTPHDEEWLKTTSSVANEIGMSGQRLNKMLVACGIIYRAQSGEYLFTSEYLHWNLGKSVSCIINEEKGQIRTYIKWNTRGRAYIHALNDTNWDKRRAWHLLKNGKEVTL